MSAITYQIINTLESISAIQINEIMLKILRPYRSAFVHQLTLRICLSWCMNENLLA